MTARARVRFAVLFIVAMIGGAIAGLTLPWPQALAPAVVVGIVGWRFV